VEKRVVMSLSEKLRLDSKYFCNAATRARHLIAQKAFEHLGDVTSVLRKGIFDIKADTYTQSGEGVPFLRITDLTNGLLSEESTAWISEETHRKEAATALRLGDIAISKTAYPAASLVTLNECNVSQDIIATKLSTRGKSIFYEEYVVAFLCSSLGMAIMDAEFQGNVQEHFGLIDARKLPIPILDRAFQEEIRRAFQCAINLRREAYSRMSDAENSVAAALGLRNWIPPAPLAYSTSILQVQSAGRLDAQFFAPRFEDLIRHVEQTGQAVRFGDILTTNSRGNQPSYAETGLPVVNSKHVRRNRVHFQDMRFADPARATMLIQERDLLLNGTGVGTIGRASPYLRSGQAIPDNHVTVLRVEGIDPIYLSVYLNSLVGQLQVERYLKGSSGQIELYPSDIAEFVIWRAPDNIQKSIHRAILDVFSAERRAGEYLEAAKCAVEVAIEKGHLAGLSILDEVGG
jgi:type I restriction enzyme M protein